MTKDVQIVGRYVHMVGRYVLLLGRYVLIVPKDVPLLGGMRRSYGEVVLLRDDAVLTCGEVE